MLCFVLFFLEAEKSHLVLSKSLKAVASSEPHALLQYLLFAYANKEEELAQHQQEYRDFATETKDILEIWTKKMIQPMRDVIQDHQSNLKKKNNKDDNNTNNAATSAEVQQALASSSTPVLTDNTATANELLKSLLPIHAKLFEKHRLQEMKALLRQMLIKQLSYHAKALESYSQLLECLSEIEDIEVNNNQSSSQSPQAASQQPRNYKQ